MTLSNTTSSQSEQVDKEPSGILGNHLFPPPSRRVSLLVRLLFGTQSLPPISFISSTNPILSQLNSCRSTLSTSTRDGTRTMSLCCRKFADALLMSAPTIQLLWRKEIGHFIVLIYNVIIGISSKERENAFTYEEVVGDDSQSLTACCQIKEEKSSRRDTKDPFEILPLPVMQRILIELPLKTLRSMFHVSKYCRSTLGDDDFTQMLNKKIGPLILQQRIGPFCITTPNKHLPVFVPEPPTHICVSTFSWEFEEISTLHGISNTFFGRDYELRSAAGALALLATDRDEHEHEHAELSVNGGEHVQLIMNGDEHAQLIVINPVTKEYICVPCLKELILVALGFSERSENYKVLAMNKECTTYVHTVGTDDVGKWRKVSSKEDLYFPPSDGTLVQHIISFNSSLFGLRFTGKFKLEIVKFDLDLETFSSVDPPPDVSFCLPALGVINGSLALTFRNGENHRICWRMSASGSWEMFFKITNPPNHFIFWKRILYPLFGDGKNKSLFYISPSINFMITDTESPSVSLSEKPLANSTFATVRVATISMKHLAEIFGKDKYKVYFQDDERKRIL